MPNNEFGDFQTPFELALGCLRTLGLPQDARVLEPTCGVGNFLEAASLLAPDSDRIGVELHREYAAKAAKWGEVKVRNIFATSLPEAVSWQASGPLFVVGNPPWVTSAELNRMDSSNLPPKENFKGAKGLDAILGSSNFDVCEFIILKVLQEYKGQPFKLGMLCKTQVARNVIEYAASAHLPVVNASLFRIDAMKWFGAGVDACWFIVEVDPHAAPSYTCSTHSNVFVPAGDSDPRFGVVDGRLVSNVERYEGVRVADGTSPYEWRSGLKHDASGVFELVATPAPATKAGEVLDLEPEFVFPFLKSTDIFRGRHRLLTKWVIVPQRSFGAPTNVLASQAPRLWSYLIANGDALDGRKSSIYRNRPRFSVFGHGDYTYAPFKVAISGLHKEPVFRLVAPLNNQPVVLDDTCYFIPFWDATEAALATATLNSQASIDLIESMVFWDSKRPITKRLLARLDLNRLPIDRESVLGMAARVAADNEVPFETARAKELLQHLGGVAEQAPALF